MDESASCRFVLSIRRDLRAEQTDPQQDLPSGHSPQCHYIPTPRSSPGEIKTLIALVF